MVGRLIGRAMGSEGKFEVGDREVLTEAAVEPLDSEAGLTSDLDVSRNISTYLCTRSQRMKDVYSKLLYVSVDFGAR